MFIEKNYVGLYFNHGDAIDQTEVNKVNEFLEKYGVTMHLKQTPDGVTIKFMNA